MCWIFELKLTCKRLRCLPDKLELPWELEEALFWPTPMTPAIKPKVCSANISSHIVRISWSLHEIMAYIRVQILKPFTGPYLGWTILLFGRVSFPENLHLTIPYMSKVLAASLVLPELSSAPSQSFSKQNIIFSVSTPTAFGVCDDTSIWDSSSWSSWCISVSLELDFFTMVFTSETDFLSLATFRKFSAPSYKRGFTRFIHLPFPIHSLLSLSGLP